MKVELIRSIQAPVLVMTVERLVFISIPSCPAVVSPADEMIRRVVPTRTFGWVKGSEKLASISPILRDRKGRNIVVHPKYR